MIDFLASTVPLAFGVVVAFTAWKIGKRVLSREFGEMMMPAEPYAVETATEALQRAKRKRIAVEHASWDAQFHATDALSMITQARKLL